MYYVYISELWIKILMIFCVAINNLAQPVRVVRRARRRQRIRLDPYQLPDREFKQRYRFSKPGVRRLVASLLPFLQGQLLQTIGVYPSPLSRLSVQVWIFLVEGISRELGVFVWVQHSPQHTRNSTGIFNNTLDNAYCIVYKIYISLIQFFKWFIAPVIFSFWLTILNFHTGRVQIKLNTLIQ